MDILNKHGMKNVEGSREVEEFNKIIIVLFTFQKRYGTEGPY